MSYCNKIFSIILVLGISSITLSSSADTTCPSPDIKIDETKNVEGIEGIFVKFYLNQTIEDVWKFLSNIDYLCKLFPAMDKIEKIKKISSNEILWKYHMKTALGKDILNVRRFVDENKFIVKWKRTEGDLKYYSGSWELTTSKEYPGWIECHYSNFINHAWWVPYEIVQGISKENARAMVDSLRKLVKEGR